MCCVCGGIFHDENLPLLWAQHQPGRRPSPMQRPLYGVPGGGGFAHVAPLPQGKEARPLQLRMWAGRGHHGEGPCQSVLPAGMEGKVKTYPMLLCLPGGIQARVRIIHVVETNDKGEQMLTQLVSAPPAYELRDGTTVDADVTIPDDLAGRWRWQGSFLSDGGVAIFTGTYGLAETFAIARRHDADQRVITTAETRPQQLMMDLV
jgi:hypothetical protein